MGRTGASADRAATQPAFTPVHRRLRSLGWHLIAKKVTTTSYGTAAAAGAAAVTTPAQFEEIAASG
jgi:hypothetical protein